MLASAFAFSVMSLFVKVAGQRLPSQEIILARALISLILSYGHLRLAGLSVWGNNYKLLIGRGVVGFLALSCFFYSLTHLPIAESTVIQYVYPVFTALLARYSLGERLGRVKLAFSLLSLVGVVLIAQPTVLFGGSAASLNPLTVAIALGGLLAIGGSNAGTMLAGPRLLYALAEKKQLPRWLGLLHTRFRTPVKLIHSGECATKSQALKRELEIKDLSREKKLFKYGDTRSN